MAESTLPLLKYLTESGIASRRKLADAIKQSRVKVNQRVAEDFRQPINLARDSVTLDGKPVKPLTHPMVCLMLNKPVGIITTSQDERDRRTVMDILPEQYKGMRLHAVGRLDMESTGLLLLTNDGDLTYRLTHPKFEHDKEYWVAIKGYLSLSEKRQMQEGMALSDGMTWPARVKTIRVKSEFTYAITIHEGRKRQIRRMFETLGHPVLALKRVRIGKMLLGDLKEGEFRELSDDEIASLGK